MKKDKLIIAKKKFNSRLIVGTGKYKSMSECAKAIKLSGAKFWSLTNPQEQKIINVKSVFFIFQT